MSLLHLTIVLPALFSPSVYLFAHEEKQNRTEQPGEEDFHESFASLGAKHNENHEKERKEHEPK